MSPAVRLEVINDRNRQDVLQIRRDDVSEDVVDSIAYILEQTRYGLEHGYSGTPTPFMRTEAAPASS